MRGHARAKGTHLPTPSPTLVSVCAPQALELPASILQPGTRASHEPAPSYKAAVEGFIQEQRQDGNRDGGTSLPGPGTQGAPLATPHLPTAAQTQKLLQLFEAVETTTAREELLQMLR